MDDHTPDAAASKYESVISFFDHTTTPDPALSDKLNYKIQVVVPADPRCTSVISLVALFVAKDGADLEQRLLHEPMNSLPYSESMEEHVFYKWRVSTYARGDGRNTWQADPFVMMVKHSCVWIPPPVDKKLPHDDKKRKIDTEIWSPRHFTRSTHH